MLKFSFVGKGKLFWGKAKIERRPVFNGKKWAVYKTTPRSVHHSFDYTFFILFVTRSLLQKYNKKHTS